MKIWRNKGNQCTKKGLSVFYQYIDKHPEGWMEGMMDGQKNGSLDGVLSEWMDGWLDG